MNILLTSVGRRSYLVKYFQDALGENGKVHVANSTSISPAFQTADNFVVTPIIYDKEYIPFLKKYCLENRIDAIISLFDIDLPMLSVHKQEFRDIGVQVVVSDLDCIEICNDKWKTYQFLINNNFNAPKTFLSVDEALGCIHSGEISFPVMVKPRWGMGSIAVFEAENEEELRVLYKKAKRNIFNTYLKFESKQDIEDCVLVQEKLHGQEFGLDVINNLDGKYVTTICKKKHMMRAGETDCAITVDNIELKKIGEKLSDKLQHIANLDVDVFEVEDKYYVLEMNARFGGGYPFSHLAGVNLPMAIIRWLQGEEVQKDVLQERVNIFGQKDIRMIKLYQNENISIKIVDDEKVIYNLVNHFSNFLLPPLVQRGINIKEYSRKLFQYARIYGAYERNGTCCGILAVYMNDKKSKEAYLSMIALESEYRGRKIGSKLLQRVEKDALECGMKTLVFEVRKENSGAYKFYCSHGYQRGEDASEQSFYMMKEL